MINLVWEPCQLTVHLTKQQSRSRHKRHEFREIEAHLAQMSHEIDKDSRKAAAAALQPREAARYNGVRLNQKGSTMLLRGALRARLHRFDLTKRQDEQLLENVRDFRVADGKKLLYPTCDAWSIVGQPGERSP